jgi:hypothetical protein
MEEGKGIRTHRSKGSSQGLLVSGEVPSGIVVAFLFRREGVSGEGTHRQISACAAQERMEVRDCSRASTKSAHLGFEPKHSDAIRELFSNALLTAG